MFLLLLLPFNQLTFYILLSLCFTGILFSTLVFGPACGFILGSVCTKVYVDAVFIDTSELALILCLLFCCQILQIYFLCFSYIYIEN